MIEPHTESDIAALLIQFLVVFGNVIDHHSYYKVEAVRHYLNIFAVLVGQTSSGRKGTSLTGILDQFKDVFPDWYKSCRTYGLASGEGLIFHVRDKVEKQKQIRDKDTGETLIEYVVEDLGVSDKRLLVTEQEFASVLKMFARESNILSTVLRNAWDSGELKTLTKNCPDTATGAHISIIGHITLHELRKYLSDTDLFNGLGNRFLWVCVKRSKRLPFGGEIDKVDFSEIRKQLARVVQFSQGVEQLHMSEESRKLWALVYDDLSDDFPGLHGSVVGRAAPYVLRLSSMYALLDESRTIFPEHLYAALAVWKYCEQSCRHIFGSYLEDSVANKIFNALSSSSDGLTRNQIRELFQGHKSSHRIEEGLKLLRRYFLVGSVSEDTGGRPTERWFVTERSSPKSALSVESPSQTTELLN